jgi:hypothetical protein
MLNATENIAISNSINIVPEIILFMPSPLTIYSLAIQLKIFHTMLIEECSMPNGNPLFLLCWCVCI